MKGLFIILQETWLVMAIRFVSTEVMIYRARTFSLLEILPLTKAGRNSEKQNFELRPALLHTYLFWYKMLQFRNRNEKITRLFAIIFWTLVGFHIIFGCIAQLIFFAINCLNVYRIVDIVDTQYATALFQWIVNKRILSK